jgi:competence protein CoiA
MPLTCVTKTGEILLASNFDAMGWRNLAADNRNNKHLVMPCCGRLAILKTSHLGTMFFAHVRKEGAVCPTESEDHLLAKDLVARAAIQAGWHAETEVALKPHGLVADVLVTKGKQRIAFEIQRSRQKWGDTEKRHAAYKEAGVRALWLFRQRDYPRCKEIPAFRLVRDKENGTFQVWVWREGHDYEKVSVPTQAIELQRFISGALAGQLRWMPALGITVPVVGYMADLKCYKGHDTAVLAALELEIDRVLAGHANIKLSVESFSEHPELLRSAKAQEFLEKNGLKLCFGVSNLKLSVRFSEPNFRRYLYPRCSWCKEIIGQWQFKGAALRTVPGFELSLELSDRLVSDMPGLKKHIERWWFDKFTTQAK